MRFAYVGVSLPEALAAVTHIMTQGKWVGCTPHFDMDYCEVAVQEEDSVLLPIVPGGFHLSESIYF